VSTSGGGDPFGPVYYLLDQLQAQHFEMGTMVGEYRELIEALEERPDEDRLALARSLPGAKYLVAQTYVREAWLKVEAELKRLFPA
jgi:hypothetical protein